MAVTDGRGGFYIVRLLELKATYATGEIVKRRRLVGESVLSITLAQGIIKSQRMDWLVEKATELGIKTILPVQTAYSVAGSSEIKLQRWQRLARAAVKQSGRSVLPRIEPVCEVAELSRKLAGPVLVAHPDTKNSVRDALTRLNDAREVRTISLLVGPEGGFSEEEVAQFRAWGYHQVHLGERRLRSETAAITMLTLALQAVGEL